MSFNEIILITINQSINQKNQNQKTSYNYYFFLPGMSFPDARLLLRKKRKKKKTWPKKYWTSG